MGDRPYVEMLQCPSCLAQPCSIQLDSRFTCVLLGCALLFACMLFTCAPPGSLLVSGSSAGCGGLCWVAKKEH